MARNRKARHIDAFPAGSSTNTTYGPAFDGEGCDDCILFIKIVTFTGVSGQLVLQGSPDGGTTWFDVGALGTARTTLGNYSHQVPGPLPKLLRMGFYGTFVIITTAMNSSGGGVAECVCTGSK